MNNLDALREQVLALPEFQRAALLEDILTSFDPDLRKSVDQAWAAEAEDRLEAFGEGKIESVSMEEARNRVRA
ncbi:MAG: addiction module protein [Candidatus Hydrogenedentes bacterium]|nr:addiction module protein [Candidatus Hydrogenedentota bacterium]